jgi:hypothetical protein
MNKTTNAIVLRLYDSKTVDRLDDAAHTLKMSRSAYIRRCIVRGLDYSEAHEMQLENRGIKNALAR